MAIAILVTTGGVGAVPLRRGFPVRLSAHVEASALRPDYPDYGYQTAWLV